MCQVKARLCRLQVLQAISVDAAQDYIIRFAELILKVIKANYC